MELRLRHSEKLAVAQLHCGNLMQSRHYSLYLALQLKANMERAAR